jgi:dethiobiotin synthetase
VRKPIETGVGPEGPLDAAALRAAAGSAEPLEVICPVALPLPAAPAVAAAKAGRAIALEALVAGMRDAVARHDFTVVEGAGGLLVPIAPGYDMADLARDVGLPLVVVARTRLGSINHTRLTLDAARERGLRVAGVVLCHADGKLSEADAENLAWLKGALGPALIGEVPALGAGELPPRDAIDLDALLERCVTRAGVRPPRPPGR